MKRVISKVLGIMLAVSIISTFAACKTSTSENNQPVTSTQTETQATTTQEEQPKLEPFEINYYYPGTVQADQEVVQTELSKLVSEKINATVKLNCVDWGQYADKMKIMLATGENVDLCFTANWINTYIDQVGKDAFLDLGDLLSEYGQDIKKQVPEGWWSAPTIKGKIYAVPNIQHAASTPGLQVRRDLAEKYNLDVSKLTGIADIEPFLELVKKNEKDVIPFRLYKDAGIGGSQYLLPKGYLELAAYGVVDLKGDPYKVLSIHELPASVEGYKLAHNWFLKGYIPSDAATKADVTAETKANKYAVIIAGNVAPYGESDWKAQHGTDMIIKPFAGMNGFMDTGSICATMNAIPKASKDPARTMMFLNLLYADKQIYTTLCNGIEGVHYTKAEGNAIETIKDTKYNPGADWMFGSVFNGFIKKGDPADKAELQKAANENAVVSPLLGFNFDSTPVKSELAQLNAAYEEFRSGISTGTLDTDKYYPKMMDKLKKAGLDKYLAELQKQVDEWRVANGK